MQLYRLLALLVWLPASLYARRLRIRSSSVRRRHHRVVMMKGTAVSKEDAESNARLLKALFTEGTSDDHAGDLMPTIFNAVEERIEKVSPPVCLAVPDPEGGAHRSTDVSPMVLRHAHTNPKRARTRDARRTRTPRATCSSTTTRRATRRSCASCTWTRLTASAACTARKSRAAPSSSRTTPAAPGHSSASRFESVALPPVVAGPRQPAQHPGQATGAAAHHKNTALRPT